MPGRKRSRRDTVSAFQDLRDTIMQNELDFTCTYTHVSMYTRPKSHVRILDLFAIHAQSGQPLYGARRPFGYLGLPAFTVPHARDYGKDL